MRVTRHSQGETGFGRNVSVHHLHHLHLFHLAGNDDGFFGRLWLLHGDGGGYTTRLWRTGGSLLRKGPISSLRLRLQQPAEGQAVVLLLVALLVRIGTKIAASGESLEERQLLSAVQASHMSVIGS